MREGQLSWDKFPQQFLQRPSFCPITTPFVLQIGTLCASIGAPNFCIFTRSQQSLDCNSQKEGNSRPTLHLLYPLLHWKVKRGYQAEDSNF